MYRLIRASLALCATGLMIASCAQGFPKRYDWYGHHPALYGLAFKAAATEAVVQNQFGEGFYTHLGEAAYGRGTRGACDTANWDRYFVRKDGAACDLIRQNGRPTCLNVDGCARFEFDPQLVQSRNMRSAIERALEDPCSFLTPPDQAGPKSKDPSNTAMSAVENWKVMQCDGRRVVGRISLFDAEQGVIQMTFEEQDRA